MRSVGPPYLVRQALASTIRASWTMCGTCKLRVSYNEMIFKKEHAARRKGSKKGQHARILASSSSTASPTQPTGATMSEAFVERIARVMMNVARP